MFSCLKVPLKTTKFFWVDAPKDAPLSSVLLFVDNSGKSKQKQLLTLEYLDNNLWRGEIPPFNEDGFAIIITMLGNRKSNRIVKIGNPTPKVLYQAYGYQEGLTNLEFLQLDENAEVFYYDKLYEISDGFYYGNIKDEISIVCVEDLCSVYHKELEITTEDCAGVDEKLYEECIRKIEEYKEKALLLEKKLAECLSTPSSNVVITPAGQNSAINSSEGHSITVLSSSMPSSKIKSNINVTEKTKLNSTLTSSFSTKLEK